MDLTKGNWTLRCTTNHEAPVDDWNLPKMEEYKNLLGNATNSRCNQYNDTPIDVTVPGEVHQHLLEAGIL
jgi:hypothetical protein